MLIRVEIGIDAPGIDALLRRTFGRDAEAQLVQGVGERFHGDGILWWWWVDARCFPGLVCTLSR